MLLALGVGAANHVPATVDRGRLAHGGRAEGAEIGHRADDPAKRVVLREPAGVLAAPEKEHLVQV